MIDYGNVLDCIEDWEQALKAYKDAYEIARSQGKTRMLPQQISALENMQYCYLVRLKSIADARAIQLKIHALKEMKDKQETAAGEDEHCSETDEESETPSAAKCNGDNVSLKKQKSKSQTHDINISLSSDDDDATPLASPLPEDGLQIDDNALLASVLPTKRLSSQGQNRSGTLSDMQKNGVECLEKNVKILNHCNHERRSKKRPRVVLLDDEDKPDFVVAADIGSETHASAKFNESLNPREEPDDTISPYMGLTAIQGVVEQLETSEMESVKSGILKGVDVKFTSQSQMQSFLEHQKENPTIEENTNIPAHIGETDSISNQVPSYARVQMGDHVIKINLQKQNKDEVKMKTIDWLKKEIVETYGFCNPAGLKPSLWHVALNGRILQPSETLNNALAGYGASDTLEAIVDCWVAVPLIEKYQLFCKLYQQDINVKLMNCLSESKVLEDKICASDCKLDENSAWPLLMALSGNGSFSHLDFSHNALGSQSVHKIQELIAAGNQPNLGLTLDLHNNNLGAASIAKICECPVTLSRLEVLNLSDNKLTDAAARFIAYLIKNSQALEVLKLENCDLTTRTILKLSAALHSSCPLVKLSIGKNNPISSLAIAGLLDKLSCLSNVLEIDLTGIRFDKQGLEGLVRLIKSSQTISALGLGNCLIQNEGALRLNNAICACDLMIVKLDISFCGLENDVYEKLCSEVGCLRSLLFLNLSGNKLCEEGAFQMASVLSNSNCRLKTLVLKMCHLGWPGLLTIMNAIQGNTALQHLHLAENMPKEREALAQMSENQRDFAAVICGAPHIDHKLEPKTPKSRVASEGLRWKHEHNHTVLGTKTGGTLGSPTNEACKPLNDSMNNSDEKTRNKGEETEDVSSPNWKPKKIGLGVVSDSEDDAEEDQSTNLPLHISGGNTPMTKNSANFRIDCFSKIQGVATEGMGCFRAEVVDALSSALSRNEGLKLLDVSDNGLTSESADKLFAAWVASTRLHRQPKRHTINEIIHFTVDEEECCGRQACCDSS